MSATPNRTKRNWHGSGNGNGSDGNRGLKSDHGRWFWTIRRYSGEVPSFFSSDVTGRFQFVIDRPGRAAEPVVWLDPMSRALGGGTDFERRQGDRGVVAGDQAARSYLEKLSNFQLFRYQSVQSAAFILRRFEAHAGPDGGFWSVCTHVQMDKPVVAVSDRVLFHSVRCEVGLWVWASSPL